jgi:cytochrome P450
VHAWTVHRDESVFGPETDKFRPERWLENTERAKNMDRYNLAFGHGARICVGKVISSQCSGSNEKNISLMEMQKLIPSLLRRYNFQLVDPKKPWKTTCHWFVHQEDMDCYVKTL